MLRKTFKVILALTIPIGTIMVLLSLYSMTRFYTPTTKNVPIKVIEGEEVYMVPANYIWSGRDRESALSGQVNFHMLYPGAEPVTKENEKEFNSLGWAGGRLVSFTLKPKTGMHFLEHYREVEKEAREKNRVTNLGEWLQLPFMQDAVLLKKKSIEGEEIYIRCDERTKYIRSPSCSRYFSLTESTYVYFTFSRDRLDEWKHVETELATLMNNFRIKN